MSFYIKLLTSADLQSTLLLQEKHFHELTSNEKSTLQASLDSANYQKLYKEENIESMKYFVGKVEQQVVGLVGIYTQEDDKNHSNWLGWFCVDEEYRGLGYGEKLLQFAIRQAKDKKSLKVYCYNAKEYEAALAIYKKYGFVEYKREDDCIYLEKNLFTKREV